MRPFLASGRALQLLAAGVCFLLAAGLGVALDGTRGEVPVDRLAGRVVGPPSPVPVPMAIWLAHLADRGPTAAALAAVALIATLRRRLWPALAVVVTGVTVHLLVGLGKGLVDRTLFGPGPSYPSGHVAGATAVLTVAMLVVGPADRRLRWVMGGVLALLPVGTALGAIWTQSHVMTDVVGGALVGAGGALFVWSILVPAPSPAQPGTEGDRDASILPVAGRPGDDGRQEPGEGTRAQALPFQRRKHPEPWPTRQPPVASPARRRPSPRSR